jgi:hypothetical protein
VAVLLGCTVIEAVPDCVIWAVGVAVEVIVLVGCSVKVGVTSVEVVLACTVADSVTVAVGDANLVGVTVIEGVTSVEVVLACTVADSVTVAVGDANLVGVTVMVGVAVPGMIVGVTVAVGGIWVRVAEAVGSSEVALGGRVGVGVKVSVSVDVGLVWVAWSTSTCSSSVLSNLLLSSTTLLISAITVTVCVPGCVNCTIRLTLVLAPGARTICVGAVTVRPSAVLIPISNTGASACPILLTVTVNGTNVG